MNITLLEVSYEVANMVGGIYTVLASKMSYALESVTDYIAIGPYYEKSARERFRAERPPSSIQKIFDDLESVHGIRCHYGRWLTEKNPKTILVDAGNMKGALDDVKFRLWEEYGIDSWGADDWFNEPVLWSKAVGILIEKMVSEKLFGGDVVAHFHEWLTGAGLLHLKSKKVGVPTVFTTHSTVLGRAIAEGGWEDLYDFVNKGLTEKKTATNEKAYEYGVQAKHLTEKAMAKNSDVFTTVSEIMARECEFVLGRKPDVILSNGLDMNKFPDLENVLKMHAIYTEKVKDFLTAYFIPYYDVDFDDSLICFISGRHEFRNKGIDLFIDSLGMLNQTLKKSRGNRNVIGLICVPEATSGRRPEVVEHLKLFENVEKILENETERVEKKFLRAIMRGEVPKSVSYSQETIKKLVELGKRLRDMGGKTPPLTPFEINGEDSILVALKKNGLMNKKSDRVKVVYYPVYLSENDGLLGMKYYNAMAGCDVGVFPSYYESWGYTPLEAAALGLHSITTDLSGFGKFIKQFTENDEMSIKILHRDRRTYAETARELHDMFLRIYMGKESELCKARKRAKELSMLADWGRLFQNYVEAYKLCLKNGGRK